MYCNINIITGLSLFIPMPRYHEGREKKEKELPSNVDKMIHTVQYHLLDKMAGIHLTDFERHLKSSCGFCRQILNKTKKEGLV